MGPLPHPYRVPMFDRIEVTPIHGQRPLRKGRLLCLREEPDQHALIALVAEILAGGPASSSGLAADNEPTKLSVEEAFWTAVLTRR